jgi:hypothetical protein
MSVTPAMADEAGHAEAGIHFLEPSGCRIKPGMTTKET